MILVENQVVHSGRCENEENTLMKRIEAKAIPIFTINPEFPTKNMLIELTNMCNHQCLFCANSKMTRKKVQ